MKLKHLIRLTEQQEVPITLFYKLATDNGIKFEHVFKFLSRLERLRRQR